jgi:hypothetical protein
MKEQKFNIDAFTPTGPQKAEELLREFMIELQILKSHFDAVYEACEEEACAAA